MVSKTKTAKNGNGLEHPQVPAIDASRIGANDVLVVTAPKMDVAVFRLVGTAPYVQNKFGRKAQQMMRETQEAGSVSRGKKKREPKDFEANARDATYVSEEGWYGMPASAFRAAMIDACRLVGFKMTYAKLSVFIEADGLDASEGTPLVRMDKESGEPEVKVSHVVNSSMVADLRARPMWRRWSAKLRVRFDADQFSAQDVANLLTRVGMQVGIGEGRPNSKRSNGMGWGTFRIEDHE